MNKKSIFSAMLVSLLALSLVFVSCSGKKAGGGSSGKANPASDFTYDATADGSGVIITGFTGKGTKIVIPAKIEDLPVVEIGDDVFNGETFGLSGRGGTDLDAYKTEANEKAGITAISIPNTITKIGAKAFANTAITKIVIPDNVIEIGESLFRGCKVLEEVTLSDNITKLPAKMFDGAASLKKVNLPKKLTGIKFQAFVGCSELADLVIPDEVTAVAFLEWFSDDKDPNNYAFGGCGKLPLATRSKIKSWGYEGDF